MTAQKKREILTGGIAALLIVCAVAARRYARASGGGLLPAGVAAAELDLHRPHDVVGRFTLAAHCADAGAAVSGGDGGALRVLAEHPDGQVFLCRHACRHPIPLVRLLCSDAVQ